MVTDGFSFFGRYRAEATLLHRIDPRIKLGGILILVVAVFSSQHWAQLTFLTGLTGALIYAGGMELYHVLRAIRPLRWLLVFTLVVHVLLSPGHTLFGVPWLSRDGLTMGLMADIRLVLALIFSSVLTLTTSPAEVAGAVASMLRPLTRFGLSIYGFSVQIMLVLHFIPILREEAAAAFESRAMPGSVNAPGSRLERVRSYAQTSAGLVLRLVDRADALSTAIADGETAAIEPVELPSPRQWGTFNWWVLAVALPALILILGCLA